MGTENQVNPDNSVTYGWVWHEGWSPAVGIGPRYLTAFFYSITNFAPEVAGTDLSCTKT